VRIGAAIRTAHGKFYPRPIAPTPDPLVHALPNKDFHFDLLVD